MKIFYRPYILNLTLGLMFLVVSAHYVLNCFYQELTFFNYEHLKSYLLNFFPFISIVFFSAYSLWSYRSWSLALAKACFSLVYLANLFILWDHLGKIIVFYLLFLAIVLFFFYGLLKEEFNRASYQTSFLKHSLRKELGRKIEVNKSDNFLGELIYWDETGGVIELKKDLEINEKSIQLSISLLDSSFDVSIGPVIYCTEQKRLSFRFLSSDKNSATLTLIRKLKRMGWEPEKLV